MSENEIRPSEIDLDRNKELRIRWSDGRLDVYPLGMLRLECPCAGCREARRDQEREPGRLPVVPSAEEQARSATAASAELVGNYALRLIWRDGHSTGLYDFGLLRSLGDRQHADS